MVTRQILGCAVDVLAGHPGGVGKLLVASLYVNRGYEWANEPSFSLAQTFSSYNFNEWIKKPTSFFHDT